jgi:hypothetical protein
MRNNFQNPKLELVLVFFEEHSLPDSAECRLMSVLYTILFHDLD